MEFEIAETTTDDVGTSTTLILGPVTIEEKAKKKNDVKARSMLLMALPNKHLMTFHQYKDAKTLFTAIETRFGENEATKKTQKTLLKQLYEIFSATGTESLDLIFNKFQKLVSQLAVLVWRNKSDLDTMSLDDLYNNFKIVKQEVRGTTSSNTNLEQIHDDDLEEIDLKWQLAMLSMRAKRVPRNQENRTRNQETTRWTVNVEDTSSKVMVAIDGAGFDWSYMANNEAPTNMAFMVLSDSKLEKISNEKDALETKIEKFENASQSLDKLIGSQVTDNKNKGFRYVSNNAVPPPHTGRFSPSRINLSHTGLPEFAEPSVQSYGFKPTEVESNKEDEAEPPLKKEKKTVEPSVDKVEVEIPKHNDKPSRKLVKYVEIYRTQRPKGNISYLTDFKEFDGGWVVRTECFILSHDFKLADESYVLLKVPKKNNMYSVDMKSIVPKKDLTCCCKGHK
nr:ribonuclease H-like domain-containing protein [Tanacetum cinerariifolium]